MMDMDDEFDEFDTPAEEILAVVRSGEPVTFGVRPQIVSATFSSPGGTATSGGDRRLHVSRELLGTR